MIERLKLRMKRTAAAVVPNSVLSYRVPKRAADLRVALTFDDGPHSILTPKVLQALKSAGATATFFTPGYAVQSFPDLALQIVEEGHSIGNHSHRHRGFGKLSTTEQLREIEEAQKEILAAAGVVPRFFRPPQGRLSARLLLGAASLRMTTVMYSRDSWDWKGISREAIRDRCVQPQVSAGEIILLHDDVKETIAALPEICADLQRQGYRLTSLDELFNA